MPLSRPSLSDLVNSFGAIWRTWFPGADTTLRNSPDGVFVYALARSTDEDLSFTANLAPQLFPWSAIGEYLQRWAAWKNVQQKGATQGTGVIGAAAGAGIPGSIAPATTTQLQTSNGGTLVQLTADCTIADDGSITAQAAAVSGGSLSNIGTGVVLTFVGTPDGFPDTLTVTSAFSGGADAETDDQLRVRTQRRYSQPSFGGNQNDWQNAALAVPGVTRIFTAAATPTPGAVTLYPMFDGIRANGIPDGTDAWIRPGTAPSSGTGGAGDQLMVLQAVLLDSQGNPQRPVCAAVYVKAVTPQALNWTVSGVPSAAAQAAIALSITALLIAIAKPGGTIPRSAIDNAIANTAGVPTGYELVVPAADVTMANAGTIAVTGVGTYE